MQEPEAEKKKSFRFKLVYAIVAVVAIAVAGSTYFLVFHGSAVPVVVSGDNVSVFYTGSFTNGTVFQSNFGQHPFSFIVGANQTIPGFNNAVLGMKVGETKIVTIPVDEAYGPVSPTKFITYNASILRNMTIFVGESIQTFYGPIKLTAINGTDMAGIFKPPALANGTLRWGNYTNVTLDFNSPLAGHAFVFKIKVTSINK